VGNYATAGQPLFALVDSHSFYVVGYFEETKLRHIREGAAAQIVLQRQRTLQGHVSSIGRAIYDQSVETDSGLVGHQTERPLGASGPARAGSHGV
jgi:multidrug resistance efflux pump